jgi:pimeloyl-ACP methyl ester carboxylesterase
MAQLAALQARDGDTVNPACRTQLLSHGRPTDRVIVLIHGMTNCPCQYQRLAPLFFEQGYNVLTPRMPGNGLRDRDTQALGSITVADLQRFGHQIVDIAHGLGAHVTVAGISAGGTLAAWLAQTRHDVGAAVLLAPLFGILPDLPYLNDSANFAVMQAFAWAPNLMTQRITPFKGGPPQSYRGFATRGLASVMQLGRQVYRAAAHEPPQAGAVLLMLNPVDPAVNGAMSHTLLRRWRSQGAQATLYTFDPARKLIHDVIDPQQREQQCDYVYPILLEQITRL